MTYYDPMDLALLRQVQQILRSGHERGKSTAHDKNALLLWAGKHYLLVREGLYRGGRAVSLWSRERLLLNRGNPERSDMVQIALAAIDPVHFTWEENFRRMLYNPNTNDGRDKSLPAFSERRWCESLANELIAFAKAEDESFDERCATRSAAFDAGNIFSQRVAKMVQGLGFEIHGNLSRNFIEFAAGCNLEVRTNKYDSDKGSLRFTSQSDGKHIHARVYADYYSFEEFEILVRALAEIRNMRNNPGVPHGHDGSESRLLDCQVLVPEV